MATEVQTDDDRGSGSKTSPDTDAPVFVVGFPRSGTTLMRFLLNDHPDLAIAPETHFVSHFWVRHKQLDFTDPADRELFWSDFTSSERFHRLEIDPDVFRREADPDAFADFRSLFKAVILAYAENHGKARFGEKTPDHYQRLDTLFEWFPDARVVFVIRDPRAVVASYLTLNQQWTEDADAYTLARRWHGHVTDHLNKWRDDPRVHVVRYEQLVHAPETELQQVLSFAGLRDETLAILNRPPSERLETGSLQPGAGVSGDNVDAWRSRLSRRHIALIEGINASHMAGFGYLPELNRGRSWITAQAERARQRSRRLLQNRRAPAS